MVTLRFRVAESSPSFSYLDFVLIFAYVLDIMAPDASVARKVTLPDFWSSSPDLWFIRAEGEFTLKAISQESTRHAYLVSALKEEHALRVQDALRAPDPEQPYTALKKALLAAYSVSDHQKACTLLDLKVSATERPTEILDKMVALLPADVSQSDPGWLFRAAFIRLLPPDVAQHLVAVKFETMRAMALQANQLFESRAPAQFSVAAVDELPLPPPPAAAPCAAVHDCCNVNAAPAASDWCWYHRTHGARASHGRAPCSWRPRQAGNGRGRRR